MTAATRPVTGGPDVFGVVAGALAMREFGVLGGLGFILLAVLICGAINGVRRWWAAR